MPKNGKGAGARKSVRKKTREGDLADARARKPGSKAIPKASKALWKGAVKAMGAATKMKKAGGDTVEWLKKHTK